MEPWTMPEWMEPYRDLFYSTGGNSIEDLMNDHDTNTFNNQIRWVIIVGVRCQVALLERLHADGRLK
jgi:hypothetical protein